MHRLTPMPLARVGIKRVAVLALSSSLLAGGTAAVAPSVAAAAMVVEQTPTASAATWKTQYAQESVKIRQKPDRNSTALGLVPKGSAAKSLYDDGAFTIFWGGVHNACGSKGTLRHDAWNKIKYNGLTGYVPDPCMYPSKP